MGSEHAARALSIFEPIAELSPADRKRILAEQCGDDSRLRGYVEVLLANYDAGLGSFLCSPCRSEATLTGRGQGFRHAPPEGPRPWLPGYKVLDAIGVGGMGVVYAAEQEDPPRRVALKVIRSGDLVTPSQIQVFRREVRSLARLNHRSIASIHDAGCTPGGQHYLTMELVRGVPLSSIAHGPSLIHPRQRLRWRLRLLLEVCDAIDHAHRHGVIHRDLKPANILVIDGNARDLVRTVEPRPRVKIIDFGLARILDAKGRCASPDSVMETIQGTLAYMSPEQARGEVHETDPRTDVYSIGMILCELLTGRLPYDVRDCSLPEAIQIICKQEPDRPGRIERRLRGDLETIVLKAIEKDPERRYPSVTALADDIRRHLTARPIRARSSSRIYRIRKHMARRRQGFAFAALLVVLTAAVTVMIRQTARTNEQALGRTSSERPIDPSGVAQYLVDHLERGGSWESADLRFHEIADSLTAIAALREDKKE